MELTQENASPAGVQAAVEVWAGAAAGTVGGLLMALFQMIQSAAWGMGFFAPARLIAATTLGSRARAGSFGTLFMGLSLHLLVAAVLGVGFAFALHRRVTRPGPVLLAGLAYGLLVLVTMTLVVLPWVDPVMRAAIVHAPGSWVLSHALFGLGLGSLPALRTSLAGSQRSVLLEQ